VIYIDPFAQGDYNLPADIVIGAKHNIPIHTHPDFPNGLFDRGIAERFAAAAPNPLILEPGEKIKL